MGAGSSASASSERYRYRPHGEVRVEQPSALPEPPKPILHHTWDNLVVRPRGMSAGPTMMSDNSSRRRRPSSSSASSSSSAAGMRSPSPMGVAAFSSSSSPPPSPPPPSSSSRNNNNNSYYTSPSSSSSSPSSVPSSPTPSSTPSSPQPPSRHPPHRAMHSSSINDAWNSPPPPPPSSLPPCRPPRHPPHPGAARSASSSSAVSLSLIKTPVFLRSPLSHCSSGHNKEHNKPQEEEQPQQEEEETYSATSHQQEQQQQQQQAHTPLSPFVFERARVEVTMQLTTEVIPRFWAKRDTLCCGLGTMYSQSAASSSKTSKISKKDSNEEKRVPTLSEILRNKTLLGDFREFMRLIENEEQLDFIEDVAQFQEGQNWSTSKEMRWRALQLYSKWIDERSDFRLNSSIISASTVERIKLDLFGTVAPNASASPKPPPRAPPSPLLYNSPACAVPGNAPAKPASDAPQKLLHDIQEMDRSRSQSFDSAVEADLKKLSALLPV